MASIQTNMAEGQEKDISETTTTMQADLIDQESVKSGSTENVEQKQLEAKNANDRLQRMEKEQQEKEQQMRKLAAELELTKQRTEEARKVAELNKSRAENAERQLVEDCDTVKDFLTKHNFTTEDRPREYQLKQ
ncbi:Hypothetical predicted protein [Paramuricea clavata]|uniref:Uncharacterized protein n=1 Tax=Paramuricea clavata TaxID=317549 RepID=A0A6S7I9P4_PARCT|nr:Hypothetical predicted protein [Paramuricea clavata]